MRTRFFTGNCIGLLVILCVVVATIHTLYVAVWKGTDMNTIYNLLRYYTAVSGELDHICDDISYVRSY